MFTEKDVMGPNSCFQVSSLELGRPTSVWFVILTGLIKSYMYFKQAFITSLKEHSSKLLRYSVFGLFPKVILGSERSRDAYIQCLSGPNLQTTMCLVDLQRYRDIYLYCIYTFINQPINQTIGLMCKLYPHRKNRWWTVMSTL